jgi:hypothetical protein
VNRTGTEENKNCDFGSARYDANGELDPTYHQDGIAGTYFSGSDSAYANAAEIDSQGRMVIVGESYRNSNPNGTNNKWVFALARLLPDHNEASLQPGNVEPPSYEMGNQVKKAETVFMHPTRDVHLVRMEQPFVMNNSTTGYSFGVSSRSEAFMDGKTLFCTGYGVGSSDGGSALLEAYEGTPNNGVLGVEKNDSTDQGICSGDSGGSCWYQETFCSWGICNSWWEVVGVNSSGSKCPNGIPDANGKIVAADAFRDWADYIMSNN